MIELNKRFYDSFMYSFFLKKLKGTCLHPQWLSDLYHPRSRRLLSKIETGCVVDIGSGDSNHGAYIRPSIELFKFDFPDTNYRYQNPPHVYADASCMPVLGASIDSVLLLEVLEHVERFDLVLSEIRRMLKPNGTLYLSAPFIYPGHDEPNDYHRFTRHGLAKDLAHHGFKIEIMIQHGNSIVVALQMINLSLLEWVVKIMRHSMLMGLLISALCYPVCLLCNLFASPFLCMTTNNAAVFGYFVVARLDDRCVRN